MRVALFGLPFSGKSTVFRALVGKKTQPKASASGKVQLNIGTLDVKEERLEKLGAIFNSEKITHPQINLVDLAYSAEAASKGMELNHFREFDLLALVVGLFASAEPVADLANIESELILADMQVLQNRIAKVNKERKARPKKEEEPELLLLERCQQALEEERFVKDLEFTQKELKMLAGFQLLTLKPIIVIANISEEQLAKGANDLWYGISKHQIPLKIAPKLLPKAIFLEKKAQAQTLNYLCLCAKLEAEIEELPAEERPQFLQEMGLVSLSRDSFIQTCFQAQNQILFFTVVGKEARAWPIPLGTTALGAAGAVHSDMERGFIRAEVINYKDFVACGSFAKAKEQGLLRLESKEYLVQDGDIINFKFSV